MKFQQINTETLARIGNPRTAPGDTIPDGWVAGKGCAYVQVLDPPEYDTETQRIQRATPTLEGDGWEVVDLTEEEIARNALEYPDDPLKQWWHDLSDEDKKLLYKHAVDAIFAWERGETNIMIQLIIDNNDPEILHIKAALAPLVGLG